MALLLLANLVCPIRPASAQTVADSLLLYDDFSDNTLFDDLTLKHHWGTFTDTASGFQIGTHTDGEGLAFPAIFLTDSAIKYAGYRPGTTRASQAIDYVFKNPIKRDSANLIVEFDATWGEMNNSSWGESGRLVLMLLHDYPEQGIPFGAIDDLSAEAPFGRPSYNIRIRNNNQTGPYYSNGFMLYGGGHDHNGEIERNDDYWMPGFSSEAGGGSPGLGNPYPLSPTQKNEAFVIASDEFWMHYTWKLMPERLELFVRKSAEPVENDSLVFFMETPFSDQPEDSILAQINLAHGTNLTQLPTLYHWFGKAEALRVFFRAEEQAYLANLKVTHQYPMPEITALEGEQRFNWQLYPNPAESEIAVELPHATDGFSYHLIDWQGKQIMVGRLQPGLQIIQLPRNKMKPGLYIFQVMGGKSTSTKKLLIR